MFLYCTFNVQASEENALALTDKTLALKDQDPEMVKCFEPVLTDLMEMQKKMKDDNKQPNEDTVKRFAEKFDEVLTCMETLESLTLAQRNSIKDLKKTKKDFQKTSEDLKKCVETAGEGVEEKEIEEKCKGRAAEMNKAMQAFLQRVMSFMLEFIKDESLKRTQIFFAAFGLAVKEKVEEFAQFLVDVILFTFAPVIELVEGLYEALKGICALTAGSVKSVYQCFMKSVWPNNYDYDGKIVDGDAYYDLPQEKWSVFIAGERYEINEKGEYENVNAGEMVSNKESYVAVQLFAKEIIKRIIARLPEEGPATKEEIKKALVEEYDQLKDKLGEDKAKEAINYAIHINHNREFTGDAHEIIKELQTYPLSKIDETCFHKSEVYNDQINKIDEDIAKSKETLDAEIEKGNFSPEQKQKLKKIRQMFGEGEGIEDIASKMQALLEGHVGL
jgi:hypothetical protein